MNTNLSIWAILTPPTPSQPSSLPRLTMSVAVTLRVRFRVTSEAKWLWAAAYKEPFHCSFPFLPHQPALAASLEANLGNRVAEQLRADPVQAPPLSKGSNEENK